MLVVSFQQVDHASNQTAAWFNPHHRLKV